MFGLGHPVAMTVLRSRLMRAFAVFAVSAVTVLALAGCGSGTVTIRGQIDLSNSSSFATSCADTSDFPDVSQGTQVVVKSPSETVLGSGALGAGRTLSADGIALSCDYPFTVAGVAAQSRYGVEVGSRGTVWFTAAQARNPVVLSLGG